jgi:hypothetical protein
LSPDRAAFDAAVKAGGADGIHLTCLYGDDRTRQRVAKALQELLGIPTETDVFRRNGIETSLGALTVVFTSPPGSFARLSGHTDRDDLESWAVHAIGGPSVALKGRSIRAAIVETGNPEELRGTDRDPKHVIRRALAIKGIVTQFLANYEDEEEHDSDDEESAVDHRAQRAVWDILRSAGVFPCHFHP